MSVGIMCLCMPAAARSWRHRKPISFSHLSLALFIVANCPSCNFQQVFTSPSVELGISLVFTREGTANRCKSADADSWPKLKSSVGSKIFKRSQTSGASSDQYSGGKPNLVIGGPYSSIDSKRTSPGPPFRHVNGPRTVVVGGSKGDIDDDDIHLTYEMEMTVQDKKRAVSNV